MNKEFFVYILECSDKTFYIGKTIDLEKRIEMHNGFKRGGAKYTSGRRPVILRYYEKISTITDALKREWELKKMSKRDKVNLIKNPSNLLIR